jgi:tRNA-specific 2-thiouridylase
VKIAVAMSGGVDSSVTAALLKEQGHEVIGLTMRLMPSSSAVTAARKVAKRLEIPHYVMDFRDIFTRLIIDDFCREYSRGRTPNPCVLCNRYIKFGALWEKAAEMGAAFLATGHYARIEIDGKNIRLKKGADSGKDQSYFLCRLTGGQLSHVLFPIGHLTKAAVRQMAEKMDLSISKKAESSEICFIPDNNHAGFVKEHLKQPSLPGPILDELGHILGEHRGIAAYTIGQRHGLGVAAAEPLYVTSIQPERNAIVVGTKSQTYGTELIAGDLNWISPEKPVFPLNINAKIRYRHPETAATVSPFENDSFYVKFATPQMAVTPGQTIAFYDGDTVMGGGTIIKQGR